MKEKKFDFYRIIVGIVTVVILLVIHILYGNVLINGFKLDNLIILPITLFIYIFISFDLYTKSIKQIIRKDFFNEITLTLIASIAAFAIGEYVEALAVTLFFQIGEKFEEYAVNKSRDSIKSIINLRPDKVTLYNNEIEKIVDPYEIKIGDYFLVKSGERVPIDGIVYKGKSSLDTSSMTGESIPKSIKEGDNIISGVINLDSPIVIKATKEFYDSTMSKMLELVENASSNKAPVEKFITKFSKIYTPIVIALAFLIAIIPPLFLGYNNLDIWSQYIRIGASFLVISCPCALVLSVPMAYFVSLGQASRVKILIKGGNYLDKFRKIFAVIFDKTGTITKGNFKITEISPTVKHSKDELYELVKYGEYYSTHPIANAILSNQREQIDKSLLSDYKEISGKGIIVSYLGKELLVGNDKLMQDKNIQFKKVITPFTIIYCAYNNEYIGSITIRDEIKDSSKEAIKLMYQNGVQETYILSGDNYEICSEIAKEAGITNFVSNLLPLDKVNELKKIKEKNKTKIVAYIGDGINDAPSLTLSDLGISMGINGSDLTIESSDAVIMDDDLNKVNYVIKISKKNHLIAIENIILAIGVKIIAMVLSLIPNLPIAQYIMWLAIFADVGVTIICVLNSLRLLSKKRIK